MHGDQQIQPQMINKFNHEYRSVFTGVGRPYMWLVRATVSTLADAARILDTIVSNTLEA